MIWNNELLARHLDTIATYQKIQGANHFALRTYGTATTLIRSLDRDIAELDAKFIASAADFTAPIRTVIEEWIATGTSRMLQTLQKKVNPALLELTQISGLGGKKAQLLITELGITNLTELSNALADGSVQQVKGFGAKMVQNMQESLVFLQEQQRLGTPLHRLTIITEHLTAELAKLGHVTPAGALSWGTPMLKELAFVLTPHDQLTAERPDDGTVPPAHQVPDGTAFGVGELDQVLCTDRSTMDGVLRLSVSDESTVESSARVVIPPAHKALARTIANISGVNQALCTDRYTIVCEIEAEVPAILYIASPATRDLIELWATSAPQHRSDLGLSKDLATLVTRATAHATGADTAGLTKQLYLQQGIAQPIAVPARRGDGEIAHAQAGLMPVPVQLSDIQGDLHGHSTWSGDGRATMEEMVKGAVELGYSYWAMTDHAIDLAMNGIDAGGFAQRRKRIAKLQERYETFAILDGAELNIGLDGTVDFNEDVLALFDWTVASVHSALERNEAHQMERILGAIRNPFVHTIGHLTGRKIGSRPGFSVDFAAILEACSETGTALEINASPHRCDIWPDLIRQAVAAGVTLTLGADAHSVEQLNVMQWGVLNAQAGWAGHANILNTQDVEAIRAFARAKAERV